MCDITDLLEKLNERIQNDVIEKLIENIQKDLKV